MAVFAAPNKLLQHGPAKALDESAFYLADVNGRIDRRADVHDNIRAQRPRIAGQHVDLDLAVPAHTHERHG